MKRRPKPRLDWGELHALTDFREVFRYRKARRVRVYNFRVLDDGKAELWVMAEGAEGQKSRMLATFAESDDAAAFLKDVELELRKGGWARV